MKQYRAGKKGVRPFAAIMFGFVVAMMVMVGWATTMVNLSPTTALEGITMILLRLDIAC